MEVQYKGETFCDYDKQEIESLLARTGREGISFTGSVDDQAFFTRFNKVGGFTRCVMAEDYVICHGGWEVNQAVVQDILRRFNNPPPVDYWAKLSTWFRSKWWSIPLIASIVLIPIFVQWGEWIVQGTNLIIEKLYPDVKQ